MFSDFKVIISAVDFRRLDTCRSKLLNLKKNLSNDFLEKRSIYFLTYNLNILNLNAFFKVYLFKNHLCITYILKI